MDAESSRESTRLNLDSASERESVFAAVTPLPQDAETTSIDSTEDCVEAMEYVTELIARMNRDKGLAPAATVSTADKSIASPKTGVTPPATSLSTPSLVMTANRDSLADANPELRAEARSDATLALTKQRKVRDLATRQEELDKLREAANLTTSRALHTFDCRGLVRRGYTLLVLSFCLIAVSLGLLIVSDGTKTAPYILAIIVTLASFVSGWRYLVVSHLLTTKQRESRTAV